MRYGGHAAAPPARVSLREADAFFDGAAGGQVTSMSDWLTGPVQHYAAVEPISDAW